MAVININRNQFEEMVHSGKTVLVEFSAPWCVYCRRLAPALESVAEEYKDTLIFTAVNIDDEPELAETEAIEVVPTLLIYHSGQTLGSIVAPESRAQLVAFIEETLQHRTQEVNNAQHIYDMIVVGGGPGGYTAALYRKGEDGKPEIVPEEAAIVERIFEMFLTGQPVGLIAQTLQSENIEIPGKDLSFSKNMIMNILRNEKYCGDSILQKTVTVDCISKTRKANHGEAPMYLVENSHPAIISRDIFHRTQEELARRKALRPKSDKTSITQSGKYSKYALSEVLHCAECGSRYKRVTWNIRGKKKIVWRCVSRLDYGKKYCKNSITAEEVALHGAVVRALNRFHAEDESTYLTLMKATIGEAIGINGGSEEIDLLTRRIDALNKRMLELVNETVAAGKDVESSEDEFKSISDQIEQLNRRIAAIQESVRGDATRQARLEEIQSIIAERNANETQYDDSIVRQMIECIKVHNDGKLTIIFGGGYEIEETL